MMNDFRGKRAEMGVYDEAISQTIYEDALKWFQLRYKLSNSEIFRHYAKVAIEALKKQIPKRPDFEGDGYDENGNLIYDTWICPCCNERYEVDYDDYKHCPECGQAIDWSDTE